MQSCRECRPLVKVLVIASSLSEVVGVGGLEFLAGFNAFRTVGGRDVAKTALRRAGHSLGRCVGRKAADQAPEFLDELARQGSS